jgi:hypothetical protein
MLNFVHRFLIGTKFATNNPGQAGMKTSTNSKVGGIDVERP